MNPRTLLGIGFLQDSTIIINARDGLWVFLDQSRTAHSFVRKYSMRAEKGTQTGVARAIVRQSVYTNLAYTDSLSQRSLSSEAYGQRKHPIGTVETADSNTQSHESTASAI